MKAALAALLAATTAHALVAPASRAGRRAPAPLREAKTEEKATEVQLLDVEVSDVDEFLIQWGLKEDPRVPEECRVDPMTRVKQSGKAGIAAYTITEFAFWLGSVPLAIAAVAYTTGSLPDVSSVEGKEAVAGYVFARARAGLLFCFFGDGTRAVRAGVRGARASLADGRRRRRARFALARRTVAAAAPRDGRAPAAGLHQLRARHRARAHRSRPRPRALVRPEHHPEVLPGEDRRRVRHRGVSAAPRGPLSCRALFSVCGRSRGIWREGSCARARL
jgi:hypothetical protein